MATPDTVHTSVSANGHDYTCPHCNTLMKIGGRYMRVKSTSSANEYYYLPVVCHQCGKTSKPPTVVDSK